MPAKVVVIGLDAAEATYVERLAAQGDLPTLARLPREAAASFSLGNCLDTLPAAVWREIITGRSCGREGIYFPPRQLKTGETAIRAITPDEVDPRTFWTAAGDAGHRVAVFDMSDSVLAPQLDGVQVIAWDTHNRNFYFDAVSEPPDVLDEIRTRYGDPPVQYCDKHGGDLDKLLEGLLTSVEMKAALLRDYMTREQWDLFVCSYTETHCVGHHFWHLLEGNGDGPQGSPDAVRTVYQRVDAAIGELIEAAGPEAAVVVFFSHGMGPPAGGRQLLPEVLVRLGMGSGSGVTAQVRSRLPVGVRAIVRRVVPGPLRQRLQTAASSLPAPLASPETRAIAVENNRVGGIRLNLRGREPNGRVEPGPEADALIDELRRELRALQDPQSGEPIVDRIMTAQEAFGPDVHPDVPDLLIVFRRDLGLIEACSSPRIGVVREPFATPGVPRTGDHTVESRLWVLASGISPIGQSGNVMDIGPTVLALLDVPTPEWMDGQPLVETRVPTPG